MQASPIDPRDATWELSTPSYRVDFWTQPTGAIVATSSDEWRITDADDVFEVITWAEAKRGDRTYELFVEHTDRIESRTEGWIEAPGLIRLAGSDPTASTTTTITLESI